jgi:hypothetical protein
VIAADAHVLATLSRGAAPTAPYDGPRTPAGASYRPLGSGIDHYHGLRMPCRNAALNRHGVRSKNHGKLLAA